MAITDIDHPDLIHFYTMEDIALGVIPDQVGTADAVITGATEVGGVIGTTAIHCDGSNDRIDIPFTPPDVFSVSAWIDEFAINVADDNIAIGRSSSPSNRYGLMLGYRTSADYFGYGSGWRAALTYTRQPQGFHQAVWHIDNVNYVVEKYINNELQYSQSIGGPIVYQANTLVIGKGFWGGNFTRISVDNLRIFNRWLTESERKELVEEPWPYEISGLVNVDGSPLSTQVRLYNAASGELIETLNTDANGAYQKVLSSADPIYAMAIEPNGYRPLVHGPINPALRNPS
jgi:hypothetical protein